MFDAVDLSVAQTSSSTNVTYLDRASITLEWTGSDAVGVITVEARKKKEAQSVADSDYKVLDFGSSIDITGVTGDHILIFDSLDFTDIRIQYVPTSGTVGTLTAVITAKQIGG